MVKKTAQVLGWVLVIVGILGFIPGITNDELLLGIFHVDAVHNIIHIITGAAGIYAAMSGGKAAKMYFQIFGVIYGLVAILGLMAGDGGSVLGLITVNTADNWLHVVIAVVALYLGFGAAAEE